ncbi:MAG: class I tRNA ligase family protein, partial [Planctomycetota bacterium]|nr:class I tRNA ligase family protein [Planctomycetota bacterium]
MPALESEGFARDEDVLDTWFSSALWPLNTMGWPEPNQHKSTRGLLEKFNPTSVLVTGRDIITLWVSRMVMFNRYFLHGAGPVPFRDVCINPMIQDGHGQRMSKSLGNGVDPRDIIHSHGADALRFTLAQIATGTQDARLPVDMVSPHSGKTFAPEEITSPAGYLVAAPTQTCPDTGKTLVSPYGNAAGLAIPSEETPLARNTSSRFDTGRNFCTKLWNAARFTASRLDRLSEAPASIDLEQRLPIDRWMVGRIGSARARIDQAVQEYRFADLADALYDLLWRDFCDTYLEAVNRTAKDDPTQQCILAECLHAILRLLHPVCPFV